jgi:hypothetical protein
MPDLGEHHLGPLGRRAPAGALGAGVHEVGACGSALIATIYPCWTLGPPVETAR